MRDRFGITMQVHYIPTYKFNLFNRFINKKKIHKDFPNTEKYYEQTFSIPLFIGLKERKLLYICNSIIHSIKKC